MKKCIHIVIMIFICLLTECAAVWLGAGTTGIISGVVKDAESGKPLSGANIIISGTELSTVTNSKGYFVFTNIAPGEYNIDAQMVGYSKKTANAVQVTMDNTSTVNMDLKQEAIQEEAVVVTRPKPMVDTKQVNTLDLVTSKQESFTRLDPNSLNSAIGVMSTLPGVVTEPDGSGQMHIRGGRANQIGWYVEGIPITDPNTGTFGTNLFTTGTSRFQAYTGGFAAEYGNAVSGTLNEVKKTGADFTGLNIDAQSGGQSYRDGTMEFGGGTPESFNYYLGSTLYQSNLDAPLVKEQKYADNVAKLVWPSKDNTVTVLAMQGSLVGHPDTYHDIGNNAVPITYERDWMRQRYNVTALTWSHNYSPKSFITIRPYNLFTTAVQNILGGYGTYVDSSSSRTGLQVSYTNQINEQHLIKVGTSATYSDNNYYLFAYMQGYGVYDPYHYRADVNTLQTDLYAEDSIKFNDKFTAQAGLRNESIKYDRTGRQYNSTDELYDGADVPNVSESQITPRLGVSYLVDSRTAIKASWGKYIKFVPANAVQLIYYNPSVEDFDPGLGSTTPEKSTAMEFSYEKQISDSLSCRITPFYTKYDNLGDFVTDSDTNVTQYMNLGEGRSKGIEMYLRKKMSANWQGWFSYTYQKSESTHAAYGDASNYFYTPWDQRHTFSLVADSKNGKWNHNIRADFGSGREDKVNQVNPNTNSQHANPFAIFSYTLSMDLPKDSAVGNQIYLSIYNILNNKQAAQYRWDSGTDRVEDSWMPGRFVSFGVNKSY